jgi:hypothetical protein
VPLDDVALLDPELLLAVTPPPTPVLLVADAPPVPAVVEAPPSPELLLAAAPPEPPVPPVPVVRFELMLLILQAGSASRAALRRTAPESKRSIRKAISLPARWTRV